MLTLFYHDIFSFSYFLTYKYSGFEASDNCESTNTILVSNS
jgi:hypothetical protein